MLTHPLRKCLVAAAALIAASARASAATLRPMVTLHASVVKLSDLFTDAGRDAGRVLGPGPAPGGRIVVGSRQLGAIAREFGVDWHPADGSEQAVLERPGRILAREEMMPVLKDALAAAGVQADAEVEVPAFEPPVVPADGKTAPVVTQLNYDAASGRFTAEMEVADGGAQMETWRVSGKAVMMIDVPTPVARLLPGTILQASDLHMVRLPAGRVPAGAVRQLDDALGKQLRYQAAPDRPLLLGSLTNPKLIERNGRVLILADLPGLSLAMEGRALEAGAAGDQVRVLNPASRAVLDAEVIGAGQVRIDPAAPPLEMARPGAELGGYMR